MESGLGYAGHSDPGQRRPRNDDRWTADPAQGLYMVADGVATSTNGAAAAQLATELLPDYLRRQLTERDLTDAGIETLLGKVVAQLSDDLHSQGESDPAITGAGTTVVAVVVAASRAVVAHLGDSRAYLFRDHSMQQLTRDHTLIQALIDDQHLDADADTTGNPARGVLTRYVMMKPPATPDVGTFDLRPGDRIVLCTDGLHGVVDDTSMADILAAAPDADEACRALIDAANRGGGPDNITVVVIDVPG
ncbi:MAG: serine/threonine-protein phosphatase [Mycobacteriaceae bacterium]|nr:serine/threonine-protein phosphatase [Mycobacteriaceae bacterium]